MKNILCPIDFSKNAENSVRYAAGLARLYKSKIILMHSYETPVIYTDVTVSSVQLDFSVLRETALKQLHKFYGKMAEEVRNIPFDLILQEGLPSARISEIAIEKKVDLIVMASTATTAVQRFLIGSNTGRVLRDSPCPVLIVPPKARFNGLKKIVYSTDLSEENLTSAQEVADFAKMFPSELIFLNVDNKSLVHDAEDLARVTRRIKQFIGYPKMRGYVCTDLNIADGITYFLKQENADLLAMATHHRHFIKALANPSITKRVAYRLDIPLMVIHRNDG